MGTPFVYQNPGFNDGYFCHILGHDLTTKNKFYSTSRGDLADLSFPKILPTEVQTLHYKLPQDVTDVRKQ